MLMKISSCPSTSFAQFLNFMATNYCSLSKGRGKSWATCRMLHSYMYLTMAWNYSNFNCFHGFLNYLLSYRHASLLIGHYLLIILALKERFLHAVYFIPESFPFKSFSWWLKPCNAIFCATHQ